MYAILFNYLFALFLIICLFGGYRVSKLSTLRRKISNSYEVKVGDSRFSLR